MFLFFFQDDFVLNTSCCVICFKLVLNHLETLKHLFIFFFWATTYLWFSSLQSMIPVSHLQSAQIINLPFLFPLLLPPSSLPPSPSNYFSDSSIICSLHLNFFYSIFSPHAFISLIYSHFVISPVTLILLKSYLHPRLHSFMPPTLFAIFALLTSYPPSLSLSF